MVLLSRLQVALAIAFHDVVPPLTSGMPFVLACTATISQIFRGKVRLDLHSY